MLPIWLGTIIFLTVLGLLIASQVYFYRRAKRLVASRPAGWQRWLLGVPVYGWFAAMASLAVFAVLRRILLGNEPVLLSLFIVRYWAVLSVAMGLWVAASLFSFLLIHVVKGAGWLAGRLRPRQAGEEVAVQRRHFLQTATYLAGAAPFAVVAYGFLRGRNNYRIEEVSVPIANLPAALDGLRIAQLTDVHAGPFMPIEEVRRIVAMANELRADLAVHTGDYTTSAGDPLEECLEELSRLRARFGAFGCLGNHEIYARTEDRATQLFAARGVRILRGKNAELQINGARLNLIGVDYQRQPRELGPEEWASNFLRGDEHLMRPGMPNILLSHNPNPFLRAAELGIELTLAGHTHGGQVQVEILNSRWSPARFMTPFISGLYERPATGDRRPVSAGDDSGVFTGHGSRAAGRVFLYVSRGLGTIAAPVRLNAPPEITLLTLRRSM